MYTLLISEDNSITTTVHETIVQRSHNVDNIQFLVNRFYKGIDMSDATVLMQYVLPSKRIFSTYLKSDDYENKDFIKYVVKANTMLTAESGDIKVSLTFTKLVTAEDGSVNAYVRKTEEGVIKIAPISPWLDFVPDEALTSIDQRLLAIEAAQKEQDILHQEIFESMAQDIVVDKTQKQMKLSSKAGVIGNGVDLTKLSEIIGTVIVGEDIDGTADGVTYLDNLNGVNVVNLDKLV